MWMDSTITEYVHFVFSKWGVGGGGGEQSIYLKENICSSGDKVFPLTLKVPVTTAADSIHKYFFIVFSEKISLDVSSESSAKIKPYFSCRHFYGRLLIKPFYTSDLVGLC